MLEKAGRSLGYDATVAERGHLAPHEGLDELVVVKGAQALLEPGHHLRNEYFGVGRRNGFFE